MSLLHANVSPLHGKKRLYQIKIKEVAVPGGIESLLVFFKKVSQITISEVTIVRKSVS